MMMMMMIIIIIIIIIIIGNSHGKTRIFKTRVREVKTSEEK